MWIGYPRRNVEQLPNCRCGPARTVSIQGGEGFRRNASSEYLKGRDNLERKNRTLDCSRIDAIVQTNVAAEWADAILVAVLV